MIKPNLTKIIVIGLVFTGILLIYFFHQDVIYDSDQIAYLTGAENLAQSGQYQINGKPDWRGVGYGYFLALVFLIFEPGFQTGVYLSILCAIFTLAGIYKIIRLQLDWPLAVSGLLIIFPAFHFWRQSTTLMTEIPALCPLVWGFYFYLHFGTTRSRSDLYLSFLCFGTSILFRPVNAFSGIFFIPLLLKKRFWPDLFAGFILVLLIFSPQFFYNAQHFGSPLVFGYSKLFHPFAFRHFFTADQALRRPAFQMVHYLWTLLVKPDGLGGLWIIGFIIGVIFILKSPPKLQIGIICLFWFIIYLIFVSFYAYHDERLLVPVIPPAGIITLIGFNKIQIKLAQKINPKFRTGLNTLLFMSFWLPGFLLSLLLVQTSIHLHQNRFQALEWIKEHSNPKDGLATSEGYLGRFVTNRETINCSKTWQNQASFSELTDFIEKYKTTYFVLPEKRLYVVTPINQSSSYDDIRDWLKQNYAFQQLHIFTSKKPWGVEKITKLWPALMAKVNWPTEKFEIIKVTQK